MMLRSLARNVEYGLVGGTLSCAAGMLAYIQTVFSSGSKGFPLHDIVMRFLIRAVCLCTVALQRLASQNLSPLAKSYPCCSKIPMKSNFMTQSTEKESVALEAEEVREDVTGEIKPCLYRLCGIVRQRDINNLEKKWVTVEDMMAGGDYAQIQGTVSVWAKLASAWHVGTCFGQYAMSYLYFTLSPTGASALAARNGRLRQFSRTACSECPVVPTTCTVGTEPMETEQREKVCN